MRAVRFTGHGEPLVVVDVAAPKAGAGEVVVDVAACGVCASDLHMIDGSLPTRTPPPVTPGHEASGIIASVGDGVEGWAPGDRVALFAGKRCGTCMHCLSGEPVERCMLPLTMGIDYDGAWAEQVVVPADGLVRVPDNVPLEVAAILCDAVGTSFNAVIDTGGLKVGERVAVFGVGGLGTHAVMLARMAGASFIAAVDPDPASRERAARLGADLVVDPNDGRPSKAIRAATNGEGVDLALDLVGANAVLKEAVASLAMDGRAVIVGVSGERIQLGPSVTFAVFRTKLLSVMGYTRAHLETLLQLVSTGRLDVSSSITGRLPLDEAGTALRYLSERRTDVVRTVLIPSDTSSP